MAPGWLKLSAVLAVAFFPLTSSNLTRSPTSAHTRAPSSDDQKYNIDDLITDDYQELLEYCYGDRYDQEDDNKVGLQAPRHILLVCPVPFVQLKE